MAEASGVTRASCIWRDLKDFGVDDFGARRVFNVDVSAVRTPELHLGDEISGVVRKEAEIELHLGDATSGIVMKEAEIEMRRSIK